MGKFWFLILALIVLASVRMFEKEESGYKDYQVDKYLTVKTYPEFSKNIQYFETDEGRLVTERWPKYQRGDVLGVKGEFLVEKNSIWFPEIGLVSKDDGVFGKLNDLRSWIESKVNLEFDHKSSELILGMLIGQNDLTPELSENLKKAGIIHIVVVSGQNLTMVFAFLAVGARFVRRRVFLVLAIMVLGIYVALVGADPPVVRAYLMILVMILAEFSGRRYSGLAALVMTGAGMLVYNPNYIAEVSFQLSFLATLGVFWGIKVVNWLKIDSTGFKKYLLEVYITSFFAWLLTAPMIISNFETLSIVAPIVNLLLLWLIPVVMVGSLASVVLPLGLGSILAHMVSMILKGFIGVIEFFAEVNTKLFEPNYISSLSIILVSYGLILIFLKLNLKRR